MSELQLTPEFPKFFHQRNEAVAALSSLVEKGYTNPDELPRDDPDVKAAGLVVDVWEKLESGLARLNPDPTIMIKYSVSQTMLPVEAGFTDREYLDDVANSFLQNELDEAEFSGHDELVIEIQAKIDEILALIENQPK